MSTDRPIARPFVVRSKVVKRKLKDGRVYMSAPVFTLLTPVIRVKTKQPNTASSEIRSRD